MTATKGKKGKRLEPTNDERAERVADILCIYADDPCSNLIDLLADALHWCDRSGVDFDAALRISRLHHGDERAEGA